jgi:hypothetical protein
MKKRTMAAILAGGMLLLAGCADMSAQRAAVAAQEARTQVPTRAEALAVIDKVNGYWQRTTPATEWSFWNVAVYHTGNLAAYEVTRNEAYRQYSERWAEYNGWKGAKSDNKAEWKLTYGETDDHVLFGDWQVCFQSYLDLYRLGPQDPRRVARAREVMGHEIGTDRVDYWWWADGLYIVMPVMTKMYHLTGDRRYLDKMVAYFEYANGLMYDPETHLYYRDARYVYPQHQSVNGKKDFWARGDGWVFAALAKVLADLPRDDPYRPLFEDAERHPGARGLLDAQPARPGPRAGTGNERHRVLYLRHAVGYQQRSAGPRRLPAGGGEGLGLPDPHGHPAGRQGRLRPAHRRPRDPRPGGGPRFHRAFRRGRGAAGRGRNGETGPLILSFANLRVRVRPAQGWQVFFFEFGVRARFLQNSGSEHISDQLRTLQQI